LKKPEGRGSVAAVRRGSEERVGSGV